MVTSEVLLIETKELGDRVSGFSRNLDPDEARKAIINAQEMYMRRAFEEALGNDATFVDIVRYVANNRTPTVTLYDQILAEATYVLCHSAALFALPTLSIVVDNAGVVSKTGDDYSAKTQADLHALQTSYKQICAQKWQEFKTYLAAAVGPTTTPKKRFSTNNKSGFLI
jgi:hypothetical protein